MNVGAASNGIVGTLQNGNLAFTGDMYVKSGTINTNLSNAGGSGRLWIGGNSGATVYLGGTNSVTYSDSQATIIGYSTTGAAGTVVLTNPNALNGAGQDTQVWSGTLDLNGQANVVSRNIKLLSGSSSSLVTTTPARLQPGQHRADGRGAAGRGGQPRAGRRSERLQRRGRFHQDRRRHAYPPRRQHLLRQHDHQPGHTETGRIGGDSRRLRQGQCRGQWRHARFGRLQ